MGKSFHPKLYNGYDSFSQHFFVTTAHRTLIWFLSDLRRYGMASLRYEHGDVCRYDIERLLLPVDIMMVLVTYGNTGVSASLLFKWILLPVHNDVNTALCASCVGMASLWYGQGRGDECPSRPAVHGPPPRPDLTDSWNNRRQESVPFVSKVHPRRPVTTGRPRPTPTARSDELLQQSAPGICAVCFKSPSPAARHGRPSTAGCHGPLWRTSATIGARNPCRLFQKSVPVARHGRPSTARSDELLQQSAPGIRAVCFKSPFRRPVTDVRPRPALTNFCNNRRQESVPFVSKVRSGGPSRTAVHGRLPRPALTDFCNNRRQESVPFVSKVHPSGPSRPAVHGPLWRTSATIAARNPCRLFQKSVPAARHGRPSTARPHGPLWWTFATIGVRNPCRLFQKSIPAARHGRPSRPALTNFWNKRRPIRPQCVVNGDLWRRHIYTHDGAESFVEHYMARVSSKRISQLHYSEDIMGTMASQITSLAVYSTVYSGLDKRKHQSSASLAFVRVIHRWPVNSPHKGPLTRKMFPFDDVIMDIFVVISVNT